jgi:uncharacterized repeat protein (TIGR01451 family)
MKILSGILLTFLAFTAAAQSHIDVQTTVQKKEVFLNDTGEEEKRLVPAEKVLPGETVYYTITFTNTSDEVADNVVVTNPIAEELMYLDGSAFGPGSQRFHACPLGHAKRSRCRRAGNCAVCGNFGMREALTRQLRLGAGFAGICKK